MFNWFSISVASETRMPFDQYYIGLLRLFVCLLVRVSSPTTDQAVVAGGSEVKFQTIAGPCPPLPCLACPPQPLPRACKPADVTTCSLFIVHPCHFLIRVQVQGSSISVEAITVF